MNGIAPKRRSFKSLLTQSDCPEIRFRESGRRKAFLVAGGSRQAPITMAKERREWTTSLQPIIGSSVKRDDLNPRLLAWLSRISSTTFRTPSFRIMFRR